MADPAARRPVAERPHIAGLGHHVAPNWVQDSDLPKAEKAVAGALCRHAGPDGGCWPSIPTLARETGYSARSVQYALRCLEVRGALVWEARTGADGRELSRTYRLLAPPWDGSPDPPKPRRRKAKIGAETAPVPSETPPPPGATVAPAPVQPLHRPGATTAPEQSKENRARGTPWAAVSRPVSCQEGVRARGGADAGAVRPDILALAGRQLALAARLAAVPVGLVAGLLLEHPGRAAEVLGWLLAIRRRSTSSTGSTRCPPALLRWALRRGLAPPGADHDAAKGQLRGELGPDPRARALACQVARSMGARAPAERRLSRRQLAEVERARALLAGRYGHRPALLARFERELAARFSPETAPGSAFQGHESAPDPAFRGGSAGFVLARAG